MFEDKLIRMSIRGFKVHSWSQSQQFYELNYQRLTQRRWKEEEILILVIFSSLSHVEILFSYLFTNMIDQEDAVRLNIQYQLRYVTNVLSAVKLSFKCFNFTVSGKISSFYSFYSTETLRKSTSHHQIVEIGLLTEK